MRGKSFHVECYCPKNNNLKTHTMGKGNDAKKANKKPGLSTKEKKVKKMAKRLKNA